MVPSPDRSAAGMPLRAALQLGLTPSAPKRVPDASRESRRDIEIACICIELGTTCAMTEPLLRVSHLVKNFPVKGGLLSREVDRVHAVDDVSFELSAGETLGLVGESGCGKSTTGRCMLRLIEPTPARFGLKDRMSRPSISDTLTRLRRDMQIMFQDPYASLNPRMTVGAIIGEALTIHQARSPRPATRKTASRNCWNGRAEAGPNAALSARVLRRPAPAHRHRAGAGGVDRS